jgi:Putative Flp pilus-assembly TadE/G-like
VIPVIRDDRGSLTLFAVVLALGLLAMTGLVVDGGAKLTAQRRANNLAEQAARAGAEVVDVAALRTGTEVKINPTAASAAARAYLAAAGQPTGQVVVRGDSIDVTVTRQQPTAILGLLGVRELSVTGHGSAQLLEGIREVRP